MNETLKTVLIALVSSGFFATVVKLISDRVQWRRQRKAEKEDHAQERQEAAEDKAALNTEQRLSEMEVAMSAQSEALKYLLYDRIRHLGQAYIAAGEIDFDDRRILNDMHRSYHSGLHGNGDLDGLMRDVNTLPLKISKTV